MNKTRSLLVFFLLSAFLLHTKHSHGQMMLEAADQGHISVGPYTLAHSASDQGYQLGPDDRNAFYAIPYFMFDIPTLADPIQSAKFSIYNPADMLYDDSSVLRDQGVSNGSGPFEVKLWDYTGDPTVFISDFFTYFGPGSPAATPWGDNIEDLRSGKEYGSRMMDSSLDGSWVDFYLTGDALADIMAAQGSLFSFGAWQENFNSAFHGNEAFGLETGFENQIHPLARLEIQFRNAPASAIPEPSTYGLCAALTLGLGILSRKIRRMA